MAEIFISTAQLLQKWKFIFSFKGVVNCRSMKQSKFTDQPKVKYWSLQKVTIVLVIASKSVDRFYRSLENVPIVLLTTSKKFCECGFNVSKHKKNNAFAVLFRVFRIMRTSIVQIVRPMSPKHEKTTLFPLLWRASETVFRFFAQAHLLTTLR